MMIEEEIDLIFVPLDSLEREIILLFLDNYENILDLREFPKGSGTRIHLEMAVDRLRNKISFKEREQ